MIFIVKFFFTKSFQKFWLIQLNGHILVSKRKKNKTRWNKSAMKYVKYVIKNVMDIPYWLVCRLKKNQMEGRLFDTQLPITQHRRYGNTGLSSFQLGGIKLERFLPKNQLTQRKFLNFEFWINGELSKSAKIWLSKSIF